MTYLLHHLLSVSAQKYPERDAVVFRETRLTYGALDKLSSRLAYVLRAEGVRRGDRVGISLPKSLPSIVSIFGILKAGAVYVPLDPAAPAKRLAYIIKNCEITHLITAEEKISAASEVLGALSLRTLIVAGDGHGLEQLALGSTRIIPWHIVENAPEGESQSDGIETDLAYVLYTSGSTGTPKGVMISHRAALTFIDWSYDCFRLSCDDVVSNHAPLHFDLSIFDIFTTLKAGGTVVLVPDGMSTFPVALSKFIAEQRITVWYSVPSALILMLNRGNFVKYQYPHLRLILFAGEVFPVKYLRALRQGTRARLFNLYGPTETNVCTFYEVTTIPPDRIEPFPIGKAIANVEVFAVNESGGLIKPGEQGELYVRGPGLMSGYWGDSEKTRAVLAPNTFQSAFDEKVYRTGDVVELDEGGNYVYIGRTDNMVKSRGYRIELGEIEASLYSHPKIKEVAVIAIPDEEVTNRLKAYIVPDGTLTDVEVQRYCRDKIPAYMVPEMIEFRESLPKTSTGKIDRQALR